MNTLHDKYKLLDGNVYTLKKFKSKNPSLEYHINKLVFKLKQNGFILHNISLDVGIDDEDIKKRVDVFHWQPKEEVIND